MTTDDQVAVQFEANRTRLQAVAYRMLGSRVEAEDAVQEAWLRLDRTGSDRVDNLGGWLTTVVARVCLDRLRTRQVRREEGFGVEVPVDLRTADGVDPADQVLMADSVGAALLLVLDSLPPAERVAFVLHDVFAVPFDEIAEIVDRTPDAARQLASRGRRRLQGSEEAVVELDLVQQRELVDAFLHAARSGDFEALVRVLHPDVVLRPDAAAQRLGALRDARGAELIAARMAAGGAKAARRAVVSGMPGLVWAPGGAVRGVVEFTIVDGRITAIDVTGDPDRLATIDIVVLD